jgi:ribosomal protein S18 acetylase RimI-like enzyme
VTESVAGAVVIRAAEPRDLDALADIYLSGARHHVALDPVTYRLPERQAVVERLRGILAETGGSTAYLAALDGERVVGSTTVRLSPAPSAGSMLAAVVSAEIGIAVLDEARGRGFGTALMAAAETWAIERGARLIVLDASARNTDAVRLYERLGYEIGGLFLRKTVGPG